MPSEFFSSIYLSPRNRLLMWKFYAMDHRRSCPIKTKLFPNSIKQTEVNLNILQKRKTNIFEYNETINITLKIYICKSMNNEPLNSIVDNLYTKLKI